MSSLKKLSFASGQCELVDSEFFVPVPDGFHACKDRSVIGVNELTVLVVPKDCSFYGDASDYELSLSIGEPGSLPDPISHENIDAFIDFVLRESEIFDPKARVNTVGIRKGGGAIYQLVDCEIALKTIGFVFAKEKFYIFQIIWNHQGTETATSSVVEEFKKQAEGWINRIRLIGEKDQPCFGTATPSKKLYPHYNHIRNATKSIPGVVTVVNATGTEYEFIPLKRENTDICNRIAGLPVEPFPLSDTAWEMAGIFRVDKSVFDAKHDRECQLKNGYMHRAYMMSALRSFFWTLDAYCEDNSVTPEQVTAEIISGIVEHIANRGWLNYTDDEHGSAICHGQDYHVYFVPDVTSSEDWYALKPSQEDFSRVIAMQSKIPSYFEVLSDVWSLEELRDDLEYIYPAIRIIYDELAKDRDPYQQLTGNKADILYAWCALTIAAKEPFFSEDGPVNCWFEQETGVTSTPRIHVPKTTPGQPESTELPAMTCTKVKKSDCTINDLGVFEKYNGCEDAIILPNGIEEIGTDAFSFSETLRIVVIPEGVREIGNDAFWGCEALEQVFLPSTLEKIEFNAFRSCESLAEIIIPDGVWSIGMDAFTGCKNLKDIYVPFSVISVEMDAFNTYNDDTVIHTPQWSSAETYAEENDMKFDHRQAPVRAIPKAKKNTSQAKAAAAKVAATTGNPEDFEIVDGVLKAYKGQEEHLVVPDGIHTIAEKAFDSIYNLKTIVVPEGVHTIEDDALHYCFKLESVTLPSTIKTLSGFAYLDIKKLHIPVGVETIGRNAFQGCGELRKVILPPSVTQLEEGAFSWCSKKKDVYIPESVTSIADDAFEHSPRMILHVHPGSYAEEFAKSHKVKFDNEIQVYLDALEGKKPGAAKKQAAAKSKETKTETVSAATPVAPKEPFSLSATGKTLNKYEGKDAIVVVPDGVTEIDAFAFSDTKVTAVTLPDSVETIGMYAFSDCTELKEINIPASVTSVDRYAFFKCSSLKEITWPGSVKKLPNAVCDNCLALETVIIEEGITEIGQSAFSFCKKLKDIFLPISLERIGDFFVLGLSDKPTLHVYSGSYAESYAKKEGFPIVVVLTPEQEAEQKRKQEEEKRRKREYEERCRREAEERARKAAEEAERRRKAEAEEAERRRKAAEEAERKRQAELAAKRAHYDELQKNISEQERIIAVNRGWFGEQAKARKAAKEQLAVLQSQLALKFPEGRP